MPKIYLHVGTHKTGTTSIQSLASKNREMLSNLGLCYPDSITWFNVDPRLQSSNAHFSFANALVRSSPKDKRMLSGFRNYIEEELSAGNDVLISAESLFRHVMFQDGSANLGQGSEAYKKARWDDGRERFILRLYDYLGGLPVEVVMYLRRPDSFMESMYSEALVSTGNRQDFAKFVREYTIRFEYSAAIERFSRYWKTHLFNFDKEKSSLPTGFFKLLGLPLPTDLSKDAARASVPKSAVLWLRRAKSELEISDRDRKNRWVFGLQKQNADLFHASSKSTFWQTKSQRNDFLELSGLKFGEVEFDRPSDLPPTCIWDEAEHADAEKKYARWVEENAEWLAERAENRVPTFINPQAPR